MVRFATFNVENLFARPKAFNLDTWEAGEPVLAAFAAFNALAAKPVYRAADKVAMTNHLVELDVWRRREGIIRRNPTAEPRWAWLRANRGAFAVEREGTGMEIVAEGRGSWIGWLELATEPTDEVSTRMTARVIRDLGADVLGVVEAEDRPALDRFNDELLDGLYGHAMLIDGNDKRGIDVGLLAKDEVEIIAMHSNVDVPDPVTGDHLFSRDCAEYACHLPGGEVVWVLQNHFKSQSGGGGAKRARQAEGLLEVVNRLQLAGVQDIVVMGDLNEGPREPGRPADNLAALYAPTSPLIDVYGLPGFDVGKRKGTFQSCGLRNRLDYIFVSRALVPKVVGGGIERRGLWGDPDNVRPPSDWDVYPEITSSEHGASDHAAVYVDLAL